MPYNKLYQKEKSNISQSRAHQRPRRFLLSHQRNQLAPIPAPLPAHQQSEAYSHQLPPPSASQRYARLVVICCVLLAVMVGGIFLFQMVNGGNGDGSPDWPFRLSATERET